LCGVVRTVKLRKVDECSVSCVQARDDSYVRGVTKKSKLKNHWEDLDVSGRIILKCTSVKCGLENVDWIQLLQDMDHW